MHDFAAWEPALRALADGVRERTRAEFARSGPSERERLARPVGRGAGDLTFGLDVPGEDWIDRWFAARAREGPLSLLTEDRGWRHAGPAGELAGFDHGGPRIAVDPVDGTRNLMADLRSAWTVVSFAPPGAGEPRLADLTGGLLGEIATERAARFRTFVGDGTRCRVEEREVETSALVGAREAAADADDRVDHGYFPFFRYEPRLRPALATLEAEFFARLEREEGADLRSVYDDQYISNAGQLVQLLLGVYRFVVDARALVARRAGTSTVTSKPYDVGGAILCARSAGARLTAADGSPLDFPIDAVTPVDFAGYANEATRARLEPHWRATLDDQSYD